MSHQRVLETSNGKAPVDASMLASTISSLGEAIAAANACANACLGEDDPAAMARCITLDQNTADIVATTSDILSRTVEMPTDLVRQQMEVACASLEACADECAKHDHEHCQACAEACREADQALHQLLDAWS